MDYIYFLLKPFNQSNPSFVILEIDRSEFSSIVESWLWLFLISLLIHESFIAFIWLFKSTSIQNFYSLVLHNYAYLYQAYCPKDN